MTDDTVRALAEAAGLAPEYEDARGETQTIEPDVLVAVLGRLGLPAGSDAERRQSLDRLSEQASGPLPPLITADLGKAIVLPGRQHVGRRYELTFEGGETVTGTVGRRRGGTLPGVDTPGYHELVVGGERTTLAVAPPACYWPEGDGADRLWGIAAQIYSLRRPGDGGIGDFSSVAELAVSAAGAGAAALAISPVHAMFAGDPGRASPYSPSNRLLLNGLFADPARLGPDRVAEAVAALGIAEARTRWEGADLIDWVEAGRAKLALLRRLFDGLDPGQAEAFRAWRAGAGDSVENHAAFEVLHDTLRAPDGRPQHPRDWGSAFSGPDAPGTRRLREERPEDVAFHVFLQWLAEDGLKAAQSSAREAGMAIGLVADLAVGVDGGGSQVWSSPEDMLAGLQMGAPPDIYNAKGQGWGLAALDPHALRRKGFAPFLAMLRASLAWAGGIRIDHILGLHRIWVIPEGEAPTEGAYLHFPLDDLLRLTTLESTRHRAVVVGEDLGTVPGGLRKKLTARRILGMSVLWFEQQREQFTPPDGWRADSVAMTTTHDLPTVAGWWSGRDLEWKEKLDLWPSAEVAVDARDTRDREREALWTALGRSGAAEPGDLPPPDADSAPVDAALAHVASTPCRLALAPIEDLLGQVEQPNLPGTIDEHPNWRRRLPEEARLCRGPGVERRIAAFRAGRETNRVP